MTRKLTLFLVCAFEIGLILFVAAWTVTASEQRVRQIINESIQRNFYGNLNVKKELQKQLKKIEKCETSVFEATQAILASQ